MPSFLGQYKNAAKDRDKKIIRAIESVLSQSYEDYELIVIADGCLKTVELVKPYFYEFLPHIRLIEIPKQKLWSGKVRNTGISLAHGEIICYLDIDDVIGSNHLQIINDNFGDNDWVFFNDLIWDGKEFVENHCDPHVKGGCGTSNIAVRKSLGAYWYNDTYLHDHAYIQSLFALSSKFAVIPCGQYQIMHRPGLPFKYDK